MRKNCSPLAPCRCRFCSSTATTTTKGNCYQLLKMSSNDDNQTSWIPWLISQSWIYLLLPKGRRLKSQTNCFWLIWTPVNNVGINIKEPMSRISIMLIQITIMMTDIARPMGSDWIVMDWTWGWSISTPRSAANQIASQLKTETRPAGQARYESGQ